MIVNLTAGNTETMPRIKAPIDERLDQTVWNTERTLLRIDQIAVIMDRTAWNTETEPCSILQSRVLVPRL